MTTIRLPVQPPAARATTGASIALVGNPNAGKTTLFNRLTGLRAKTANFPGTTIEHLLGQVQLAGRPVELVDLPGLYGLTNTTPEERVAHDALTGAHPGLAPPDAVIVVVDATNLARNLYLASQVRELSAPTVIALNMMDLAQRNGLSIDTAALSRELGAPVIPISARSGEGVRDLERALATLLDGSTPATAAPAELLACATCGGCPHQARYDWAERVESRVAPDPVMLPRRWSDRLDRVAAHPVLGLALFASIMTAVFITIFMLADYPMTWIDAGVAWFGGMVGGWVAAATGSELLVSFVEDGVIGGVGGVLVFLPQICLLFFLISLLEDTGYLARAAFVVDRLMRLVGLPGRAFVPMLSAHACAIPAIMSTKVIENRRDRLTTILILPLLTCSARLPVYAMITALLFAGQPLVGGTVFAGAYLLGIAAAFFVALGLRRTVLKGKPSPLVLELPGYKLPSLRTATLTAVDRGWVFTKKAGTVILGISIVLWVLATFPQLPEDRVASVASPADVATLSALEAEAAAAEASGDADAAAAAQARIDHIADQYGLEYSAAGRLGKLVEPIFAPLGFDWKINVGVVSSFAAREVVVSTLAIVYGIGEGAAEDETTLVQTLRKQTHADGTPVFTLGTSLALLVFYVLAMQCLPTQAVTRRETGSWKWAGLQLGYMTVLAYMAALVTNQVVSALT